MRHQRSYHCTVCGPFTEETVMLEFEDSDGELSTLCVGCVVGVLVSIDFDEQAEQAFMAAWASQALRTNVSVVSDD